VNLLAMLMNLNLEFLDEEMKFPGPRFRMTVYVDADHAYDLVIRRSITRILVILNNTPI
jgi:hypothetical protein